MHRPAREGQIGKSKLLERFDKFAAGQWPDLLVASVNEEVGNLSRHQRRRDHQAAEENRVAKNSEVKLSVGRQALEGAELVPGTTATLRAFRNRSHHTS